MKFLLCGIIKCIPEQQITRHHPLPCWRTQRIAIFCWRSRQNSHSRDYHFMDFQRGLGGRDKTSKNPSLLIFVHQDSGGHIIGDHPQAVDSTQVQTVEMPIRETNSLEPGNEWPSCFLQRFLCQTWRFGLSQVRFRF